MGVARSSGREALVIYAVGTKASVPFCSACSLSCPPCSSPTLMALATTLDLSVLRLSTHKGSSLISYPGLLYSRVPEGWQGLCSCSSPLPVLWG